MSAALVVKPSIIVSPPKVVINLPSDPIWLHYGVPALGILLAFLAALFAYLSWRRMRLQIDLAREQIALALKDLEITSGQAALANAERAKVPNIMASFSYIKGMELGADGRFLTNFDVYITNHGTAPANNIEVLLQFPDETVVQAEQELVQYHVARAAAPASPNIEDYIELSAMVDSFGNRWATVFNRDLELLAGQRPWKIGQGWFRVRPGSAKMLWRIKCRQGDFPGNNRDNELQVIFE